MREFPRRRGAPPCGTVLEQGRPPQRDTDHGQRPLAGATCVGAGQRARPGWQPKTGVFRHRSDFDRGRLGSGLGDRGKGRAVPRSRQDTRESVPLTRVSCRTVGFPPTGAGRRGDTIPVSPATAAIHSLRTPSSSRREAEVIHPLWPCNWERTNRGPRYVPRLCGNPRMWAWRADSDAGRLSAGGSLAQGAREFVVQRGAVGAQQIGHSQFERSSVHL
jgi:hypothetical protein